MFHRGLRHGNSGRLHLWGDDDALGALREFQGAQRLSEGLCGRAHHGLGDAPRPKWRGNSCGFTWAEDMETTWDGSKPIITILGE